MKDAIVLCISGFLATIGFSVLFLTKVRRLPFAALGGLLACIVYVLFDYISGGNSFVTNLAAGVAITLYSEVFARIIKAPVTVLLLPALVPLVPGGMLYYAMSHLVIWNRDLFIYYAVETAKTGIGIAVGLMIVSLSAHLIFRGTTKKQKKLVIDKK